MIWNLGDGIGGHNSKFGCLGNLGFWPVVEDTIDADGEGLRRSVWEINDEPRNLR